MIELDRAVSRFHYKTRLALIASLLFGVVGCVGEQSRPGSDQPGEEAEVVEFPFDTRDRYAGTFEDSSAMLTYQTFETVIESENPRKVLYRILAAESSDPASYVKTLRSALYSLISNDSSLVAARAILYTYRPTGPREGELTARVWGEWLPPSGWDGAGSAAPADSAVAPNRIYTYNRPPAWHRSLSGR